MMPLPPRDTHADALAAQIISLTFEAQSEIRDFHAHHDYRGANAREDDWKAEVIDACTQFNKDMSRINAYLQKQLAEVVMLHPGQPFVLKPMAENE